MLMLGYGYDSNLNNSADPGGFTIYDPVNNTSFNLQNSGTKTTDRSIQAVASLDHQYKINSSLAIENKFTAYTQKYIHQDDKNINLVSVSSSLAEYSQDSKNSLGVSYDYIIFNSLSYLEVLSVKLEHMKNIDNTLSYLGSIKFIDKSFKQSVDTQRGSNGIEVLNSLYFQTKQYGVNTLSLTLGRENKKNGVRTDVDKDYYGITAANNYKIFETLMLQSSIDYRRYNYKDVDINFLKKREDTLTTATLGVMKTIDKQTSLGGNIQRVDNTSNHEPFDYNKYLAKVYLVYGF